MMQTRFARLATLLSLLLITHFAYAENWPCWRGPRGDGTSIEKNVPIKWSTTENVAWKTPIPGKGHSSPIIWGNRIFLTTAIKETQERVLLAVDKNNGEILWKKTVLTAPSEQIHSLNSYASSTPATDGQRIYVSFLDRDKMFVAAYDLDGNMIWEVRPGVFSSRHGYCSSPILWKDTVILNGDHDGPGYLVSLDCKTGKTIWKEPRPNNTRSYCAPIIRTVGDRNQLVLSGSKCVASYDPDTGKQHWIIDGPTEQYVASLVYNGKYFYLTCGFPDHFMQAIDPTGSGNVTKTHVVWQRDKDCAYVPSPIAFGPYFLVVDERGIASCLEADTGRVAWSEKLGYRFSASLVSADGLVYFTSDKGEITVIRPGETLDIVAKNEMKEGVFASPVISDRHIFLRTETQLYSIRPPKMDN